MTSLAPSETIVELGALPFLEGGYLLVARALDKLAVGESVRVDASDPHFFLHCDSYCKSHGIEMRQLEKNEYFLTQKTQKAQSEATISETEPVAEQAKASWGLAARGAEVEVGITGFHFGLATREKVWSAKAARYYRLAAARQWNPEILDWNSHIEHGEEIEDAIVQVMTYLIENETAALMIPARFASQVHPHYREVMQFLAIQAADEARHIEVFSRRATLRRTTLGLSSLSGQRSLQTLVQETDFTLSALLLSVMGEGTFLTLLLYLSRHAPDALTRKICRYAARDESRHVAFAMAHLMQHRSDADTLARFRAAIVSRYETLASFSSLNEQVYSALHLTLAGSLDSAALRKGHALLTRMTAEMHRSRRARLIQLGFSDDEAEKLSALHTKNFM